MVFGYIKGCWSWIASWGWFTTSAITLAPMTPADSEAREVLFKLLDDKFVLPDRTLKEGVNALFDSNCPADFKNLFLKMWQAKPKMYVEMVRCLENDMCSYFGVDPSFKRLCFRIGHYLDDNIYDLFTFPEEDAEFIKSKQLAKAAWIIIGLWVLDGESGLKRFAKVVADNEYGGAIECIRRERCRDLFGVPRIPDYKMTDDGFVLTQSLPNMPRRRVTHVHTPTPIPTETEQSLTSTPPSQELSSSVPSLHSSLLQGLPVPVPGWCGLRVHGHR